MPYWCWAIDRKVRRDIMTVRISLVLVSDMDEWLDSEIASGRFESKSQAIRYYLRQHMPQKEQGDTKQ